MKLPKSILLPLLLLACSRPIGSDYVYMVKYPSGGLAYAVECYTISRCQREIALTCVSKYKVLDQAKYSMRSEDSESASNYFKDLGAHRSESHAREGEVYTMTFLCLGD